MIYSLNHKEQTFRYELVWNDTVVQEETNVYSAQSSYVTGKHDTKPLTFSYVDSRNPAWELILNEGEDARFAKYRIVRPGDRLTVKIHIYETVPHDFAKDTELYAGHYRFNQSTTNITPVEEPGRSKIRIEYDSKPVDVKVQDDYLRYTKQPLTMNFVFITDSDALVGQSDPTDHLLRELLDRLIARTTAEIQEVTHSLVQLRLETESLTARNRECESRAVALKDRHQRLSSYRSP